MSIVGAAFQEGMIQNREEISALVDFLADKQLHHVLEIGSESGGTFFLWCHLASGMKISIDLPTGSSGSGTFVDPAKRKERNRRMKSWGREVRLIAGDSYDPEVFLFTALILGEERLDLLFIDGDHSYEGVKQDFETYRGLVKEGGFIVFHDIKDTEFHRARGCHVAKLWNELSGRKTEFVSDGHWGGIGVLQV
jgi:cephalosporin hydroxylase